MDLLASSAGASSFAPSIPIKFLERLSIFKFSHIPSGILPIATAKTSDVYSSILQLDKSSYWRETFDRSLIKNGQLGSFYIS